MKTTRYGLFSDLYFNRILHACRSLCIEVCSRDSTILDFGCGVGKFKELSPGFNIIGYDIIPELSEVEDWRSVEFSIFVASQVFYCLEKPEIESILQTLVKKEGVGFIVLATSKLGWLNKLGMVLMNRRDSHELVKTLPHEEEVIIKAYCSEVKRMNIFWLTDVRIYAVNRNNH